MLLFSIAAESSARPNPQRANCRKAQGLRNNQVIVFLSDTALDYQWRD